jgi:hypothetical protein
MQIVENWRSAWRLYSVRLAAAAGLIAAYLAANPDQTQDLLALLPDGPMRTLAAAGIGLFVFTLATGTRLARQPKKDTP